MFVARSIRTSFIRIARPTLLFSASVHYAHPSWKYNRPVEFWCYNKGAADFKLVSLKDLKSELIEGTFEKEFQALSGSDINVNDGPLFSRWFLFPDRDDATAKAILQAFSISLPSRNVDLSSRAKAEFIMGTTRSTDHLLLRVHDLRLQEHENDGDDGEVDDIAWLQSIYSGDSTPPATATATTAASVQAGQDGAGPASSAERVKRVVAHEVLFILLPASRTLITIGAKSTSMVQAGRISLMNPRSQVHMRAGSPEGGNPTLLLVLLDSFMDSVFPVLTLFGDAIERVSKYNMQREDPGALQLAKRIKDELHRILTHAWHFRGVFLELQQDLHGVIARPELSKTLVQSTRLIEMEAEKHLSICQNVQTFYISRLQERLNRTLYMLTGVSVMAIPVQVMTGFFGMNFETFEVLKWEHGLPFFCLVGAGATLLTRWWFLHTLRRDTGLNMAPTPTPPAQLKKEAGARR